MLICISTYIMKFNKSITNSLNNITEISEETDKCRDEVSVSRRVLERLGLVSVSSWKSRVSGLPKRLGRRLIRLLFLMKWIKLEDDAQFQHYKIMILWQHVGPVQVKLYIF